MSLYSDVVAGLLTPRKLQAYGTQAINDIEANTGLTPLIAAINESYVEIVKLLLENGADPDKASRDHRTPLFWATWKRGAENRSELVSALIDHKADVDATSAEVQNITPLMNAVDKLRDPEVVSLLVDAGANPTAKNRRDQTAKDLAEKIGNPKLIKALRPKLERHAPTADTVNMLVSLVLFIFAWINNKVLEGVVQGVAKKIFRLTGETTPILDDAVDGGTGEPKTVEEFQDKINDFIVDSNLGKFFQSDDNYLQTVAEKALQLKEDKSNFMAEPENLEKLVKLALYKTIIYCDDSGSMGDPKDSDSRARSQVELVRRMARICTKIVPDDEGVDLFYIHSNGVLNAREAQLLPVMERTVTRKNTPIGTRLKQKILDPYVYRVIEGSDKQFKQPLLISIITDGAPNGEENDNNKALEEAILTCIDTLKKNGYPDHAVIFQISQIGDDQDAEDFLKELTKASQSLKSLYCTGGQLDEALKENEENLERWLFKLITSPVVGALSGNKDTKP
ncbi:MAG: hypothetical protein MMC33_006712 [Icmadophila ericetorum]|nr:hypothetical protein [Icmadophila ericetorum]